MHYTIASYWKSAFLSLEIIVAYHKQSCKSKWESTVAAQNNRESTPFRIVSWVRIYPHGFGSNLTVFTVTTPDRIPEKAVSNWENSPGHLATMIDPNCDTVGVGVTIDNGRAFCYMFVGNPTAHNPYA